MQNYLTADNLTVGYRGKPILSDISMNIRRGSIVTLIGPNGAGKSTILKSIIRELSPLGGSVFLDGTALEDYSDPDFAKKTAVVMTGRPDPELMTCFDVAAAGRYPYTGRFGILSKEDKKKVMDALEMVRCESLADVLFQNTSDGQKQRILLARAICQEPELLVLDEPTSFLDIRHKLELLDILKKLVHERNVAVLMSLHELDLAVLKGTPSAKPTATAVTRTTEIWELALADIYVGKGVTRIQTQNITDQRFNSAVCGIVTGTVEEIDASVLTKQFTDFFNTYSAAVLDEFSAYKQSMEKYLTEIAGVYDSYVSKTEGLFAQYESQFNERYSSFESTLDNWDKELLSAYTEFMAKIKLFQSDAENEFNTWFESIKDKLGEDIAGSLQLQIEELAAAMQEVKKQAEAGTKETKEAIAALDERLKRVESGWGIDYKHDAVLGLCYMGAAYMSQHYERTVETAVLGATYVGNSYLANTF